MNGYCLKTGRKEETYGSACCNHDRQRPDRARMTLRDRRSWIMSLRTSLHDGDTEMNRGNIWKSTIGLVALVTLTIAVSAWAQGRSRAGFGRGEPSGLCTLGARPGGHSTGLLQELIYPCQGTCLSEAHSCADAADSAALSSISGTCSAEIEAAQSACAADRTAQACLDALTALQTCAQSALSTRQTALAACRTTLLTCRQACAPTPTPTP